ncbi:MAG: hypothetical protein AB8F95_05650 [Bacteroidia bacterium]
MKQVLSILLIICGIFILGSCENRSIEYFPLEGYEQEPVYPLYFTANDTLYKANTLGRVVVYESTDGSRLTCPRINYQKDKIAFIENGSGIPVILDMKDSLLNRVTQARGASTLCWSPDGESLVIIQDIGGSIEPPLTQKMYIWGAPYDPPFEKDILADPDRHLDVLAISPRNYAAWGVYDLSSSASWRRGNFMTRMGPAGKLEIKAYNPDNRINSLSFSDDTNKFLAVFTATKHFNGGSNQFLYDQEYPGLVEIEENRQDWDHCCRKTYSVLNKEGSFIGKYRETEDINERVNKSLSIYSIEERKLTTFPFPSSDFPIEVAIN